MLSRCYLDYCKNNLRKRFFTIIMISCIYIQIVFILSLYLNIQQNNMITVQKISQVLTHCDLYGFPVTLNFKNNDKHRSLVGGLLSLGTITLIILFFWKAFLELIMMKSFTVIQKSYQNQIAQTQRVNLHPPEVQIQLADFMFSVMIDAESNQPIQLQKQLFNLSISMKANFLQPDGTILKNQKILSTSQCTLNSFQNIFEQQLLEQFESFSLRNYQCPDIHQNVTLAGIYQSDIFKFIQIDVSDCIDFTDCYTLEERDTLIKQFEIKYFRLKLAISNYLLDVNNENELLPYIDTDFHLLFMPGVFMSQSDILLQRNQFIDDQSIIPFLHEFISKEFYLQKTIRPETIVTNQTTNHAKILLRLSQDQNEFMKQYETVDKFLAYVGGILKILFFLIGFAVSQYNKFYSD